MLRQAGYISALCSSTQHTINNAWPDWFLITKPFMCASSQHTLNNAWPRWFPILKPFMSVNSTQYQ